MKRGYYGIGMWEPKTEDNLAWLIRSAGCFGANFVFTIGNRYRQRAADTAKATRHMPLFHYVDIEDFVSHVPDYCSVVGVELTPLSIQLESFQHPDRAVYLLGGEDRTLSEQVLGYCDEVVQMETQQCLNVAAAGTIALYDRHLKLRRAP